jgi:hypothetical protein
MIKNLLFVLISIFFTACSVNQVNVVSDEPKREEITNKFIDEIGYILFLLKRNDLNSLNAKFINPNYGVYEIYKTEMGNRIFYKHSTSISTEQISDLIESFEVKQEEVTFNCSPYNDADYGWSKGGVFLAANIKPYLSNLIVATPQNQKEKEAELKRISLIEKTSYELIITNNIIFYLTKINGNWYITLIDNIKTDCSK